jgi:hypothetical protein
METNKFDDAFEKLRFIAELRHLGNRKAQTDYLSRLATEYEEKGSLEGNNAALRVSIKIFKWLAKDKNDGE